MWTFLIFLALSAVSTGCKLCGRQSLAKGEGMSGSDPNIPLMVIRNACYVLPYGKGQRP